MNFIYLEAFQANKKNQKKKVNSSGYRCGWFSAPQKESKSRAVILLCLRDGTNTITGFLGDKRQMAL